jgi:hypothetical protein
VSEDETYLHFKRVKELTGRGRAFDIVALELAAAEVPCPRLRDFYLRQYASEDFDDYRGRDPDTNEWDFAKAEDLADAWADDMESLPAALRPAAKTMLDNLADSSDLLGEDSHTVEHSFFTQLAVGMMGGSVFNPAILVALCGDDPSAFLAPTGKNTEATLSSAGQSIAKVMDSWTRMNLEKLQWFVKEASFSELIDAVRETKKKLEWLIQEELMPLDTDSVEYVSAWFAPIIHVMLDGVEERLDAVCEQLGIADPSQLFPG